MKAATGPGDDEDDPACVGNILLLIGQRLYLVLDQNTANNSDFSKLPVLLEKGYNVEEVMQTKDTTIALARHKEGKRKLILTPPPAMVSTFCELRSQTELSTTTSCILCCKKSIRSLRRKDLERYLRSGNCKATSK